ncbi:MAG: hypoxanthine phosphoribosyltransferase, partial [Bacteroidales bacterium]|nr:hypoxanthine phosphoribosyltransferase [Bacteroidales bacterium]
CFETYNMDKVYIHDKVFVPFIPYEKISQIIDSVADKLNEDFCDADHDYARPSGKEDAPVLLCILHGSILFTGELLKRLNFPVELASMKLSSYVGTTSTGVVKETAPLSTDITGKTVIVCEDIVDTGTTIVALKQKLLDKGAKDVKLCTMLLKPEVFCNRCELDYVGEEIPNRFIVGFGLDYDEFGRNLKDIYVLE